MNTTLEMARTYIAKGFSIIPLRLRDKRPAIGSWKEFQSRQPTDAELVQWFDDGTDRNLGIVTGEVSGIDVVDLDGPSAIEFAKGNKLPATPMVKTSKGYHAYFLHRRGARNFQKRDDLPQIDLRADGGYVVAPPSIHETGHVYSWLPGRGLDDLPLAALPEIILVKSPTEKTPLRDLYKGVEQGSRNETLARLCGSWASDGLTFGECMEKATTWNQKNTPPLPEGEIEGTVKSIWERHHKGKDHKTDRSLGGPIGSKIPKEQAKQIIDDAPATPDTGLKQAIIGLLLPGKDKPPPMIRRQEAGKLLLDWLNNKGGFVQSEDGTLFFFYRPERRLYDLSSERWAAWLYSLTGTNPAGTDYAYLSADCKAAAIFAPKRKVVRFAAWDGEALRVSRFDGTVFKLDGKGITEEANGENILFLDDPSWTPYSPDFRSSGHLLWFTTELPNWDDNRKMYGLVLRAWVLSIFFSELCPTRPILVLLGEKGSGKSMTLRLLLRLLFGPLSELSGIPDRPDGFTAAAAAAHLLALDNLDDFTPWLRDKLASLSTGKVAEYRKLYTSNERGRVFYRCWMTFTARTPDTLRRDDLTDRLVLLPLKRLDEWEAERDFLAKVDELRSLWWGEMLTYLNKIVTEIKRGHLQSKSNLRLADWESLCRIVAELEGAEFIWEAFVENLKQDQTDFLLEGNPIVEALNLWLETPENNGREMKARELYNELKVALFGEKKPTDWPKSVRSFAKHLTSIRQDLKRIFDVNWTTERKGFVVYQFSKTEE